MKDSIKNVLVLGGTGFIGANLVSALTKSTDPQVQVTAIHSRPLKDTVPSSALYVRVDAAADEETIRSSLADVDVIIVLTPPDARTVETVLAQLPSGRSVRIVYASTVLLYRGGAIPQKESDPLEAVTEYEQKKLDEERRMIAFAHKRPENSVIIARLGNVYGTPKNRGIVGLAFDSIFTGKPFAIRGNGEQVRDFVHVHDIADALIRLAFLDAPTPLETINITTGTGHTLNEAVDIAGTIAGHPIEYGYEPAIPETFSIIGNNEKLIAMVGSGPTRSLERGLAETFRLYQEHHRRR